MSRTPHLLSLLMFAGLLGSVSACSSDVANDCADGADNDGDGLVDDDDPGCERNGDLEAPDPVFPACADGEDNDGDGLVDLDDPGCDGAGDDDESNEEVPACRDGMDNDGDGFIDFPNDPGCAISLQDSEEDDCPDGAECPACANGLDDDGDGTADYPDDLGCNGANDDDETSVPPPICTGALQTLPLGEAVTGTFAAGSANGLISQGCGGTGPDAAFELSLAEPSALEITTRFVETSVDTIVYLQSECGDLESELGCNDDAGTAPNSRLVLPRVEPGSYVLVVDSHPGATGDFKVQVNAFVPEGEPCDPAEATCAANLECRVAASASTETCEQPLQGPTCDDEGTLRVKNTPVDGDLIISEYMANPSEVGDAVGEWFEVHATADVDIGGLQLGRAEPDSGPGSVLLTLDPSQCRPVVAGTRLLFARESDPLINGGLPAVDHLVGFGVVNSSDGLFIGMDDLILDTVTYTSTSDGRSTSLDPGGVDFCAATTTYGDGDRGTPADENDLCAP